MENQNTLFAELRKRAEAVLLAEQPENYPHLSPAEIRTTLHSLRVHQIELEMQNEELRQTQAELDMSWQRYFGFYNQAPVGYLTISAAGLILEANLTAAVFLGWSQAELINQPITTFVHQHDQDRYYLLGRKLHEIDAPQQCELRVVPRDKTAIWVHLSATRARDANGAAVSRIVLNNITERKQAEAVLHRKQALLERTEKIARVGSWEWEVATDTVTWSDELFRLLHIEPSGPPPSFAQQSELYHPEDRERLGTAVAAAVSHGTPYEMELRVLRRDGATRLCLVCGQVEADQSGRVTRLVGSLQDITERKQVENALRERDKRLHFVLEHCNIGSWEIDLVNNAAYRSPEHCHIFGYTEITAPWSLEQFLQHVVPEDRLMVAAIIQQGGAGHTGWGFECRIQRHDGIIRWIAAHGWPHVDALQGTRRIVGIVQDITESKESYQKIFDNTMLAMCILDPETLQFLEVNDTHVQLYGYSRETLLGNMQLTALQAEPEISTDARGSKQRQNAFFIPQQYHRKKDGTRFPVEIMTDTFMRNGRMVLLCMTQDVSLRMTAEEKLLQAHGELERKVLARTADLEKTNATLAMMLDYARKTETDIQERVVANLRTNILGIADLVKKEQLTDNTRNLVEHLEATTRNLAHPLARNLESQLLQLTTREIQVAHFIRLGKSTKEIMGLLNLSVNTVVTHRNNLRKKLGLRHNKINLRTFLNTQFAA